MRDYSLQHLLEIVRIVFETLTPLSISDGQSDGLLDNLIVRDANGLPASPGSSIAGVLRSLYPAEVEPLFGRAGGEDPCEAASRVHVSWGCLHNQFDKPVEGLLFDDKELHEDPILRDALKSAPIKRNRVRLDHRGCADDQGLFNRVALTAGHRFSFELSLRHDGNQTKDWQRLLSLLVHPQFRLGGATRSGLGALKMVRIHQAAFDLRDPGDFKRFGQLSPYLGDVSHMTEIKIPEAESVLHCELELTPCDYFRIGQGFESLETGGDHEPKLIPVTEHRVNWQNHEGHITKREILVPATSIKGALRHRLAYHDRVLAQCFADRNAAEDWQAENNPAVMELFGFATNHRDKTKADTSHCGQLLLDDLYLQTEAVKHITHNAIDAFTGGVRNHMLYTEEVVGQRKPLKLKLTLCDRTKIGERTRKALQRTLKELTEGRLALGAGASRGHGYFTGKVVWSDDGDRWIEGEA
jgi:CRISPR/Cas system CSM-associated protein Csm3 (group 7 of RAMP superfamily)